MKLMVIYRPNSEHGLEVERFVEEFQRWHNVKRVEMFNIDTREGSSMAAFYDVTQYPAILVARDDGYVQKMWQGETLPLMDEIAAYANA